MLKAICFILLTYPSGHEVYINVSHIYTIEQTNEYVSVYIDEKHANRYITTGTAKDLVDRINSECKIPNE